MTERHYICDWNGNEREVEYTYILNYRPQTIGTIVSGNEIDHYYRVAAI